MANATNVRRAMPNPAHVTDEIATVLFALDTGALATAAVTAQITREIARWALSRGWSVRTEGRVQLPASPGDDPRMGFVDLLIRRDPSEPDLAIEIDSTDKPWSLDKLRYAATAGMHAIWIRWGDEVWAGICDEVDVIQLPSRRLSAPRRPAADQLTIWTPRVLSRSSY